MTKPDSGNIFEPRFFPRRVTEELNYAKGQVGFFRRGNKWLHNGKRVSKKRGGYKRCSCAWTALVTNGVIDTARLRVSSSAYIVRHELIPFIPVCRSPNKTVTRLCAIIALLAVRMCNCQPFSILLFIYLFYFSPLSPRAECEGETNSGTMRFRY